MKLSATVPALVLSALASTSGTEALSGGRRSVQLNNKQDASSNNLVKRVSLAQMQQQENGNPGMVKKVKREPLAAPIAAAAGFGSIPSMNDGNMPIVGCELCSLFLFCLCIHYNSLPSHRSPFLAKGSLILHACLLVASISHLVYTYADEQSMSILQ